MEAGQLLEIASVAMEVVVLHAIRCDSQVLDAEVYADSGSGLWQRLDVHVGTAKGNIVFAAGFL